MDDRTVGSRSRGHVPLPHTADIGLRAWAASLEGLFEEAARALAELTWNARSDGPARGAGHDGQREVTVEAQAHDLVALAFAWLSELIGLADAEAAVVAGSNVESIERVGDPGSADDGPWRLRATIRLAPRSDVTVLHDVKSATYHGLTVERGNAGWTLTAYLDV